MSDKKSISRLRYLSLNHNQEDASLEQFSNDDFDQVPNNPSHINLHKSTPGFESEKTKGSSFKLPGFLNRSKLQDNPNSINSSEVEYNPNQQPSTGVVNNLATIGNLFNQDREELSGVKRVFRKSLAVLIPQLIAFGLFTYSSLNLFNLGLSWTIFIYALFGALSNIFFLILADRIYVWVSLGAQYSIIILANSFLGLGFELITLIVGLVYILLSYLAYSELEKVQLSSRLFSISHIAVESTRTLTTAMIFILALGVFNGITYEGLKSPGGGGSRPFINRVVLQNDFILENVILGTQFSTLSVNRLLVGGRYDLSGDRVLRGDTSQQATFEYFLASNYDTLTQREIEEIEIGQCGANIDSVECKGIIASEEEAKLQEVNQELYADLNLQLDSLLDLNTFKAIIRQYYLNLLSEFENQDKNSDSISFLPVDVNLIFLPTESIIPTLIAGVVFGLFLLFKFLLHWLVLLLTWVVWKILAISGFVQLDIETVEAEIVSI